MRQGKALSAWRQAQKTGEEFVTPSGLLITVRRVSLLDLAERGEIPAPLAGMVNEVISRDVKTITVQDFAQYADVINLVVRPTIVDPPVADEPDDEHLGIHELPMMDRLAVFQWANSTAEKLLPFRPESGSITGA